MLTPWSLYQVRVKFTVLDMLEVALYCIDYLVLERGRVVVCQDVLVIELNKMVI